MGKVMLIFGYGYTAQVLSRNLLARGWSVIGTTRESDRLKKIRSSGAKALVWPGEDIGQDLARATHVLVSTAPGQDGDPVLQALGAEIASRADRIEWLGYLSTTAVYGDHQGNRVDESTPLNPTTDRGKQRKLAEGAWTALARKSGLPLHIFRLAGIYGPGRGPFSKVRAGTARRIIKKDQVFSRIHVEDIATVLAASIRRPDPGRVYNVCDDEAAPPQDVIGLAAELLGLPLPEAVPIERADLSPMAYSFYAESKRVANARIKSELGIRLMYPTYREGLSALLDLETPPK